MLFLTHFHFYFNPNHQLLLLRALALSLLKLLIEIKHECVDILIKMCLMAHQ